jgi:uncharacterized protein YqjF (DUF2071 family)
MATGPTSPPPPPRERVRHAAMLQSWCAISFLHWPCDPAAIQSRLPDGLRVDVLDGAAWVGLTPFHLRGLRAPRLPALPGLPSFPETNLRTYVTGPAGAGVWFFSLDAASVLAVIGARLTYRLPYHWARMHVARDGRRVRYRSARWGVAADITVEVGALLLDPDDRVAFLTERYRLYSVGRRLRVASVEHPPWPMRAARLVSLHQSLTAVAGLALPERPALVHFSEGVGVRVGWPRPA